MTNDERQFLDWLAEIMALSQAVGQAFRAIAILTNEPDRFLRAQLEAGLATFPTMELKALTEEQRLLAIELASAKFSELITAAGQKLEK